MRRRQFLALGAAVGASSLAGCTFRGADESQQHQGVSIALEPVIEGVTFPTTLAFLPNGDHLVAERTGQVFRHTDDGLVEEPFLNVSDQMADPSVGERGFLGLELHPDFPDTPTLYVRYSGRLRDRMPEEFSHTEVLSEFEVTPDLTGVVPNSERIILEIPEPGPNHNAGDLAFGPEGYLYLGLGDGQRTNFGDEGWSWWYDQGQAAQITDDNLLGGILRIDIDNQTDDREYGIPSDNPLVGEAGRDEYYAWGLRNPYRLSFDGEDLYVGDVGEHIRESVYLVEPGDNFGWPVVEGSSCPAATSIGHKINENPLNVFNPKIWLAQTNRISPVKICPTPDNTDGSFPEPIVEYHRSGSRAVTGGYVYRGEAIPDLQGQYIFGDFQTPAPLFAVSEPDDGERPWPITRLVAEGTDSGRLQEFVLSFARDPQGEVYVLTTLFGEGTGNVRRLAPAE